MAQYACITCPEDCLSADLPPVDFQDCTESVTTEESEITDVLISTGTVPSDWTTAIGWSGIISQSGSNSIRRLTGIGDIPLREVTSREISGSRIVPGKANYSFNFDIDDVTDLNYTLMRRMQCGGLYKIWYITAGGYLYGGPTGIEVNVSNAGEVLARGEGTYNVFQFLFTWQAGCEPERILNPIDGEIVPTFFFETQFEPQFA